MATTRPGRESNFTIGATALGFWSGAFDAFPLWITRVLCPSARRR